MKKNLSSLFGATLMSGVFAFHIGTWHRDVMVSMTDWLLHRTTFTLTFYGLIAMTGLFFYASGRRGSVIFEIASKVGEPMYGFYASSAGSLLGWVLGTSIVAVLADPQKYWLVALLMSVYFFAFTSIPLVAVSSVEKTMYEFSNRWFREQWRERAIRLLGAIQICIAAIGFIHDM